MSKAYETIRNILVTEKSAVLKEANQYAFKVAPKATKLEVADAIEAAGIRVVVDNRDEKIGYKIREARSIDRVRANALTGRRP